MLFSNFTLMLYMWILGIAGFIGLITVILISIIANLRSQEHKWFSVAKWFIGIACFIVLYLSLPFFIVPYALSKDTQTTVSYYNFAAKIAVVPVVKSELYYDISSLNKLLNDGNKAIEAYEKAVQISGKHEKHYSALICEVYLWKNDKENVLKTCYPNAIAAFYLKNNDFDSALKTSNDYISTLKETDKRNQCFARAIRAAINKKKGDKSEFDTDANFVKQECSYYHSAIKYVEADELFDVFMPNGKNLKF